MVGEGVVSPRVRYAEPPVLVFTSPECGNCMISVESDGDGWECPACGTSWGWNDYDQEGTQYADWSGEEVDDLPLIDPLDGFKLAGLPVERERRDALEARIAARRAVTP
jgi:hypothetical protein